MTTGVRLDSNDNDNVNGAKEEEKQQKHSKNIEIVSRVPGDILTDLSRSQSAWPGYKNFDSDPFFELNFKNETVFDHAWSMRKGFFKDFGGGFFDCFLWSENGGTNIFEQRGNRAGDESVFEV